MTEQKFEIKEKSFQLFKVEEKKKENSPDFTGSGKLSPEDIAQLQANGGMIRLSGWGKVSNNGKVYISGFIEAQQPRADQAPAEAVDQFMVTDRIAAAQNADLTPGPLDNMDDTPPKTAKQIAMERQEAKNAESPAEDDLPF